MLDQRNTPRARARWPLIAISAASMFVAVYVLAVHTATGQRWENMALAGASRASNRSLMWAEGSLSLIQIWSLVAAVVALGVVGLLRRRVSAAVAAVGIVVCGMGLSASLKECLPRPGLASGDMAATHNSFPSGHTTAALTLALAFFLVIPAKWRLAAFLLISVWSAGVGTATAIAQWHRLSDTIAASTIALCISCVAAWVLERCGYVHKRSDSANGSCSGFASALTVIAGLPCVTGLVLVSLSFGEGLTEAKAEDLAFVAAQLLSFSAAAGALLIYWGSWRHLDIPVQRQRSLAPPRGN